jgi:hypothetical protein
MVFSEFALAFNIVTRRVPSLMPRSPLIFC